MTSFGNGPKLKNRLLPPLWKGVKLPMEFGRLFKSYSPLAAHDFFRDHSVLWMLNFPVSEMFWLHEEMKIKHDQVHAGFSNSERRFTYSFQYPQYSRYHLILNPPTACDFVCGWNGKP